MSDVAKFLAEEFEPSLDLLGLDASSSSDATPAAGAGAASPPVASHADGPLLADARGAAVPKAAGGVMEGTGGEDGGSAGKKGGGGRVGAGKGRGGGGKGGKAAKGVTCESGQGVEAEGGGVGEGDAGKSMVNVADSLKGWTVCVCVCVRARVHDMHRSVCLSLCLSPCVSLLVSLSLCLFPARTCVHPPTLADIHAYQGKTPKKMLEEFVQKNKLKRAKFETLSLNPARCKVSGGWKRGERGGERVRSTRSSRRRGWWQGRQTRSRMT